MFVASGEGEPFFFGMHVLVDVSAPRALMGTTYCT